VSDGLRQVRRAAIRSCNGVTQQCRDSVHCAVEVRFRHRPLKETADLIQTVRVGSSEPPSA
jgi:hypothetical protein